MHSTVNCYPLYQNIFNHNLKSLLNRIQIDARTRPRSVTPGAIGFCCYFSTRAQPAPGACLLRLAHFYLLLSGFQAELRSLSWTWLYLPIFCFFFSFLKGFNPSSSH